MSPRKKPLEPGSEPTGHNPGPAPESGLSMPLARDELHKLAELGARVIASPGAFAVTTAVYRVPPNGDAAQAAWVDDVPTGELLGAHKLMAEHPDGGPGVYRFDVRGADGRVAGSCFVRVLVDRRRKAPAAPAVQPAAEPSELERVVLALAGQVRDLQARLLGGAVAPAVAAVAPTISDALHDPFAALERLTGIAQKLPGSPGASTGDAEKLVRFGVELGKTAAAGKVGFGELVEKHLGQALDLGEKGLDVLRDAIKERASIARSTPTEKPAPAPDPKPADQEEPPSTTEEAA